MTSDQSPSYSEVVGGRRREIIVATWLFVIAAMILVMVVLGGVTRLTHSGLSMVEWKPVTGWLPPFDQTDWQSRFEKYQASPEFRKLNSEMTLSEFKSIFWLEFLHRLWGRIIGVAFLIPFLVFLVKGWISHPLAYKLVAIFVLGGLQGGLGWFMVMSGLVDRPDVSQYRLAAHFGLALVILGYIQWTALGILKGSDLIKAAPPERVAVGVMALLFLTAVSGAFVAGLDAGFAYNTFPTMDGAWIPEGVLELSPAYLNLFENVATVQFEHRVLAMTSLAAVIVFWLVMRRRRLSGRTYLALGTLCAMVFIQVALGISTLLLVVPVELAAAHQAGAVVLIAAAVWVVHELRFTA